ncbi:SDR family NAD(P)-dependent oxidoreductase [Streptomyces acidicola]|uniref:SDR family NAD(P)-dependent oxidoreductase n=1 Tax=Streptomyces acidicola TaxID=2596892 RepID=UPI0038220DAA
MITGAAGGIGRAVVDRFVSEGATVLAVDRVPVAFGSEAVIPVVLDITDETQWRAFADEHLRPTAVDILVNNAAIGDPGTFLETDADTWDDVLRVNQLGSLLAVRAVIPGMLGQGAGAIVNISSIVGAVGMPFSPAYHATKGAIRQLTKHLTVAYGSRGIRANTVLPGTIRTPLTEGQAQDRNELFLARTPMGRQGTPPEVASAVVFLCSDEASFVNGAELAVDGGYLAL